MIETHKRSVLKAVTYRIMAIIITSAVVFLVTKKIFLSIGIGSIDAAVKVFAYYFHERAWNKISFGKGKMEYQI